MFIKFGEELINLTTIVRVFMNVAEEFDEHTISMENANFMVTENFDTKEKAQARYRQICNYLQDWELIIE